MIESLILFLGMLLGGGVAWLVATTRVQAACVARVTELEARARASESVRDEMRQQVEQRERELAQVRAALEREGQTRVEVQTRLEAAQRNLEQQQHLLKDATDRLTDRFKALSAEALRDSNQAFLALARQALDAVVNEARGDIGKRQEAIDNLIRPLQETLRRYEEQIAALESGRERAYAGLEEQMRTLSAAHQQLQRETGNLVTALRTPQVRGRWGETTLQRVVELAGMAEHIDYVEQTALDGELRLRPDLIVRMPGSRAIIVDAKAPLDAYLDAVAATTEEARNVSLRRHAQQLRQHLNALAAKAYWERLPSAAELVVMFIPGESFFAAAVEADPSLIEDGMASRVVMATPTTLLTILRAVVYGWRQEQIAENARRISDLGKQLYERLGAMAEHLSDIGRNLGRATEAYNKAVGSLETRIFPAARRFKELGAAVGDEIPVLDAIEETPRQLSLPSLGEHDKGPA